MTADLGASFRILGSRVVFDQMQLITDGAVSDVTGAVELAQWPEQTYHVKSRIQLPRMRELFFAGNTFSLHGERLHRCPSTSSRAAAS